MTAWDVLDKIISNFSPIIMALVLVAILVAFVIFITGFSKHGINFLKYGFKQMVLNSSLEKRFDQLEAKFDSRFAEMDARFSARFAEMDARFSARFTEMDARFAQIDTKILEIETNHFKHLKNYLGILNGILLDKGIINNTEKARLDNELRGM